MELNFVKYHGAGNDFVVIDNRSGQSFSDELIQHICHRRFGIGADGVLLLEKSDTVDYKMVYINNDGSRGAMCGNGARCLVHFANQIGVVSGKCDFECNGSRFSGELLADGRVKVLMTDVLDYHLSPYGWWVDTKTPHLVLFQNEISEEETLEKSPALRYHAYFGQGGTNVNFCKINPDGIDMITYERGVEDITWACGTGAIAGACAFVVDQELVGRHTVSMKSKGGTLDISLNHKPGEGIYEVYMTGPAVAVFTGKMEVKQS